MTTSTPELITLSQSSRPRGGPRPAVRKGGRATFSPAVMAERLNPLTPMCPMLHNSFLEAGMSQGRSGRMVFEIDPALKREFYSQLAKDGSTAKDWLLDRIESYLSVRQVSLPLAADGAPDTPYSPTRRR